MAELRYLDAVGNQTAQTVLTTTETIVATSRQIELPSDGALVAILGWVDITSGTAVTDVKLTVRKGAALTGAVVGVSPNQSLKTAAGQRENFTIIVQDAPGAGDTTGYCLTVTQVAATGNGTVNGVALLIFVTT